MTPATRGGRIGILGGTLDPIHVGHVETALAAKQALDLSSVLVMPSSVPPHRRGPSASAFHRFAMAALAVNALADVSVSDEELCADGPSYTALTLQRLAASGFDRSQIYFVTGADAFAEIETWYGYPAVLDLAHFVVISRPGFSAAEVVDRIAQARERISRSGQAASDAATSIIPVDVRTPDVSSTDIRRRLRNGQTIERLVPETVERHIRRHGLYLEPSTADHVR